MMVNLNHNQKNRLDKNKENNSYNDNTSAIWQNENCLKIPKEAKKKGRDFKNI